MEGRENEGLLLMIRPPRIEDAGLEDCALPPEAIKEAFLKAASAVRSCAKSVLYAGDDDDEVENGSCVKDPGPSNGEVQDALAGGPPENPATCGEAEKGGLPKGSGDKVIDAGEGGGDGEFSSDKVLGAEVPETEGQKGACVEGLLEDLEIWEKGDFEVEESEDEKEEGDIPRLVEAYI